MTFQQYLVNRVDIIDRLLRYLPYCNTSMEKDSIMSELRNLRYEVSNIEEMTRTERQKEIKELIITIESIL